VDTNRVIPVVIIAIAVMSLVFYYAFGDSDTQTGNTDTTIATSQPTSQSNDDMLLQNGSPKAAPQATAPTDTEPVSSKEPATVVPDKMTLDAFCKAYYNAWLTEDWNTAYTMIPYDQQQEMDVDAFKQRNEQYGLASADVGEPAISKNAATVIAVMQTSTFGTWLTTWSFVKNDKDQWTVKSTSSVMSQQ
jgi:hypothetical protein